MLKFIATLACCVVVSSAVPVAAGETDVDFDTQLVALFTKAGCNSGACHGAAVGRGGFKLSLLGGDAAADYETILYELEGRRVNLAKPADSLLLAKPTGVLNHGGGDVLEYDGQGAKLLERWIRAGAPRLNSRKLLSLRVEPRRIVVESPPAEVPLKAIARFSDGAEADVTAWTVFTTSDPGSVKLDEQRPIATVTRRGRHILIARYLDRVLPLELIAPLSDEPVDFSGQSRDNFIDRAILDTLTTLRLPISPPADDATLLRRLRLDLTGTLPTPDEVRDFGAEPGSDEQRDKRAQLIERLLGTEDFTDFWTYKLANLLRIKSQPRDTAGALAFQRWLREQVASEARYDDMARTLLVATGDSHEYGPANFHRVSQNARAEAEFASELFLGARLRCANCHNHPLDRWTQDDYHGLAAVFAKLERGRQVRWGARGEVTHPRTGEPAAPRIPGDRFLDANTDGRGELAAWLTAEDNPYFAKAIVNRLWKSLMGRGLIEPTDDLRDTNPATHPQLLEDLAKDFVKHGYHLRHTLRLIASSDAYARSATPVPGNAADDRFYSRAVARPLEPEVFADALAQVTGVPEKYGDLPLGTRAINLPHPGVKSLALDILGRCDRADSCEASSGDAGGLPTRLHLINGALINQKITAGAGRLAQLIEAGRSDTAIVEEFYLRALGRPPRRVERAYWKYQLAGLRDNRRGALEDFLWSLLNCREFATR